MKLVKKYLASGKLERLPMYQYIVSKVPALSNAVLNALEMIDSNRKLKAALEALETEDVIRKLTPTSDARDSSPTGGSKPIIDSKLIENINKYGREYPYPTFFPTLQNKLDLDLELLGADKDTKLEILKRYYNTPTIEPTNEEARTGWMEVVPGTDDVIYHAPTVKVNNLPGAWEQMAQRAWESPAFQLALAPMFDTPFNLLRNKLFVRLYRATGTSRKTGPSLDGTQEFVGRWFTDNPRKPLRYASSKAKQYKRLKIDSPIELEYADIPSTELDAYKASNLLKDRLDVEYEPMEDYLIPLSLPRHRTVLEGLSGNLLKDARMPLPQLKPLGAPVRIQRAYTSPKIDILPTESRITTSNSPYASEKGVDWFKQFMAQNRIRGQSMRIDFDSNGQMILVPEEEANVGLPLSVKNRLNRSVVDRNIREFEKEGAYHQGYKEKVNELMDNVKWNEYSDVDYDAAGYSDFEGFFDYNTGFISLKKNPQYFTKDRILGHEGEHMIDHNTSLLDSQETILSDAYGDDFVNLPNTKYAKGLEDYKGMRGERRTTNLDARTQLLGDKELTWDLNMLDKVIDKTPDAKIFEAVEKANGYGRRYIAYLRDNNLLTPEKAQAFREAMKHVGGYVPWILGGYSSLNQR